MDEFLLGADSLVAGYGRIEVLHGISIRVRSNQCVGLFGPNGHGKTTLLRTISGLVHPKAGSITFKGRDIGGTDPRSIVNQGLIHIPQGNTLFPEMTVMETLVLGAFRPAVWARRSTALDRVFDLFPRLRERRNQLSRTLSGGERQMLSIGVGLMAEPELLLLDEPTLGLAPKLRDTLLEAILTIRQQMTLVVVDQDIEFLLGLADRLYLIEQGRVALEAEATPAAVHEDQILASYFGERSR